MQRHKPALRVSIVIPVYNEAATLEACLDAITEQSVPPFEVIVVDNNSTDETAEIAQSYPFVKLLREPRQGVIHARDTGFNYAHGDIIGRIDADTMISSNWVATVQRIFTSKSVDAVSGSALYYDTALAKAANQIDLWLRCYLARMLGRSVALQGANMAIRKRTWRAVSSSLCRDDTRGMHEDFDLCIHANELGYNMVFDKTLVASISFRQVESTFSDFVAYLLVSPRTYAQHGLKVQRYMYPVLGLAIVTFVPVKLLHRGYNQTTKRFSLEKLLDMSTDRTRVNPALFVD